MAKRKAANNGRKGSADTSPRGEVIGKGVIALWQGEVLTLHIDTSARAVAAAPLSASGRSRMVANSGVQFVTVKRADGAEFGAKVLLTSRA